MKKAIHWLYSSFAGRVICLILAVASFIFWRRPIFGTEWYYVSEVTFYLFSINLGAMFIYAVVFMFIGIKEAKSKKR